LLQWVLADKIAFHWFLLLFIVFIPLLFIGFHWCTIAFHWFSLMSIDVPLLSACSSFCIFLSTSLFVVTSELPASQKQLVMAVKQAASAGTVLIGVMIHGGAVALDEETLAALDSVVVRARHERSVWECVYVHATHML